LVLLFLKNEVLVPLFNIFVREAYELISNFEVVAYYSLY